MLRAVLAAALLLAVLFAPGSARAMPWWVPDTDDAERLLAVLDALWPDHPIEVVLGAPDGRDGVHFDGRRLALTRGEAVRSQPSDGDVPTQVALVRSWLREAALPDSGWAPPLPERTAERPGAYGLVLVGGGARLPSVTSASDTFVLGPASPAGWLLVGVGYGFRHGRIGARVGWSFGERAGIGSQAVGLQRVFVGATGSLVAGLGALELENALALGARLSVIEAVDGGKSERRWLPSLSAGVTLWGPVGGWVDVGGGLSLGVDTASLALRVGEDAVPILLSPVTLVGEIGVRVGCPCPAKDPLSTRFSTDR